jgi:hypothetical protein
LETVESAETLLGSLDVCTAVPSWSTCPSLSVSLSDPEIPEGLFSFFFGFFEGVLLISSPGLAECNLPGLALVELDIEFDSCLVFCWCILILAALLNDAASGYILAVS